MTLMPVVIKRSFSGWTSHVSTMTTSFKFLPSLFGVILKVSQAHSTETLLSRGRRWVRTHTPHRLPMLWVFVLIYPHLCWGITTDPVLASVLTEAADPWCKGANIDTEGANSRSCWPWCCWLIVLSVLWRIYLKWFYFSTFTGVCTIGPPVYSGATLKCLHHPATVLYSCSITFEPKLWLGPWKMSIKIYISGPTLKALQICPETYIVYIQTEPLLHGPDSQSFRSIPVPKANFLKPWINQRKSCPVREPSPPESS